MIKIRVMDDNHISFHCALLFWLQDKSSKNYDQNYSYLLLFCVRFNKFLIFTHDVTLLIWSCVMFVR